MLQVFLITGNDDFEIKNKAGEVAAKVCNCSPDECSDLEIIRGDDENLKGEEILRIFYNSLMTPPFLTPEKKIWLKHFIYFDTSLKDKSGESNTKSKNLSRGKKKSKNAHPVKYELDKIAELFKKGIDYDVTVIIDGDGVDKRSVFFKTCDSIGEVLICQKSDKSAKNVNVISSAKIRNFCAEYGKDITREAENYLIDFAAGDSGEFYHEMEKILTYTGNNKTVTIDDCLAVCSKTDESMAWDFADALMNKDLSKAITAIKNYSNYYKSQTGSASANTDLIILSTASGRFQTLVNVKVFADKFNIHADCSYGTFKSIIENLSDEEKSSPLLKGFIYRHPYYIYQLFRKAVLFSDEELRNIVKALLKANKFLVSSRINSEFVLEQCVMQILHKSA